jgi:hypothetical protein
MCQLVYRCIQALAFNPELKEYLASADGSVRTGGKHVCLTRVLKETTGAGVRFAPTQHVNANHLLRLRLRPRFDNLESLA